MNSKRVSYAGKQVYIGIDVHRSFFVASCVCEEVLVKRCRIPATSQSVISLISKFFPKSHVKTCYEAGYSGFWLHRELEAAGISNIVVHAASIEIAANNRVKTDKRDSLKMAQQLASGRLRCIHIPSVEQEQRRLLTRTREQLMKAKRRVQAQIRMKLHQFGLFPNTIQKAIQPKDVESILKGLDGNLKVSIECLYKQWQFYLLQLKALQAQITEQANS